jgi:cell division protein FtsI (penicillin-binding protein 3)
MSPREAALPPAKGKLMAQRRLKWLACVVAVWGIVIFYKLISLQVLHHQDYVRLARARQERDKEIPAPRGAILDRNGQMLAMSTPAVSVFVNPMKVPDLGIAAQILAAELHMDRMELYGAMRQAYQNHRGFLWIKRKVEWDEAQHLRNLDLDWINMQRESQRHYPNGALAAHLVGGVDFEEKGNAGIEKALDDVLRGQPGQMRLLTDVKRRGIDSQLESEPRPGTSITLTLDSRLQFVAERELAAAVQAKNAVSGSLVVMNPQTGDILALASYPTYDPNVPPLKVSAVNRQNHAVSVPFEPGSVFKVITLSAALETTNLRPDSPIDCHGGVLKLPGRVIHDSHLGYGILPMEAVLAHSSNIGAIQVGFRVGQQNMYDYVRKFGFGQKTGIQLPGESGGKLRTLKRWGTTSLASIAMGQEVSVTTVQLAQAGSVVANGGLLVRPRLVLKKGGVTVPPVPAVRVIKPDTAITMRQMMEGVVLHGTGTNARLQGYSVGGKTGTAQIFDSVSHHYTHTYNGSFMGMAPITNPQIVVVVTINGTRGNSGFGSQAAGPTFKAVATEALRVLEVPKDVPEETETPTLVAGNMSDLADPDTESGQPNILEDGEEEAAPVLQAFVGPRQETAPATAAPAFVGPRQETAPAAPKVVLPTVPNFVGKSMRVVLAEAAAKGITVAPRGSGIARGQNPPAGSILHGGERIRVQFSR